MNPTRLEYVVGKTIHGQRVRLVWEKDYAGRTGWSVHQDPISQRDDPASVGGLTDDTILAMAEAVRARRTQGAPDGR